MEPHGLVGLFEVGAYLPPRHRGALQIQEEADNLPKHKPPLR